MSVSKAALLQAAIHQAWSQGVLSYKLHENQEKIYEALGDFKKHKQFYLLCTRRFGKSYLLLVKAIECALRTPDSRILYLAPTAKAAAEIAQDLAGKVLADCPGEFKPDFNSQTKEFRFKNGSIMRLKGVNGETADNIRGTEAHVIIMDEIAQMDNLDYIISSVCLPMTATTKGQILFATTPPTTPGHDSVALYERLARRKATVSYNLRYAAMIDDEYKVDLLIQSGETEEHARKVIYEGAHPKTTAARREYFCEFVTDASMAVFPEFTSDAQSEIVVELPKPPYYHTYVGIDPGSRDNTGFIFGYLDYLNGKFVIEDECLLANPSTKQIAEVIKDREKALWPMHFEPTRISDIDLRLINDLATEYGIKLQKAYKQDMHASVQYVRTMIQSRRLVIHPRCTNLVRQLQNVIWDKRGNDMARDASYDKHYDLISALRYVAREVNFRKDPYPENYFRPGGPGGLPSNYVYPRRSQKEKLSFYNNTPIGKKLAKKK